MAESTEVVIIGAGPAGLATGACLTRAGIPFVLVERAESVAPAWRRHYERLHLHTAKQYSALPLQRWPASVPTYPSRSQVVDYLERYAERFDLRPRLEQEVQSARRRRGAWVVQTQDTTLHANALVVASGYNREPKVPELAGRDEFAGTVLHSSEYRHGRGWRGRRALVVGVGNSGAEIALDLWEAGAEVALAVRSPVHVLPRDPFGVPAQMQSVLLFSRVPARVADRLALGVADRIFGDLSPWGLPRPSIGPISQVYEQGRIPLIDVGTVELIKQGQIEVVPGVERFTSDGVVLADGRARPFDLVVLATGYRAGLERFLEGAADVVDDRGYPRWHGTEVPHAPGLWFVGFRNPPYGQLHDISLEAPRIARELARISHEPAAAAANRNPRWS